MRIFAVFLIFVSLCACSANRPEQIRCEPATSFSCTVECTQNETAFTFDLTVAPDGNFSLYVQQPTLLQGVGFLYNNVITQWMQTAWQTLSLKEHSRRNRPSDCCFVPCGNFYSRARKHSLPVPTALLFRKKQLITRPFLPC